MDRETNSTTIMEPESVRRRTGSPPRRDIARSRRRGPQGKVNKFRFDFSYDSLDSSSPAFCSQQTVWDDIGVDVLKNVRGARAAAGRRPSRLQWA